MSPQRIQRSRAKGWRMPVGAVYVGRPTIWGNPFRVVMDDDYRWSVVEDVADLGDIEVESCGSKAEASEAAASFFADGLHSRLGAEFPMRYPSVDEIRNALAGRDLVCWCREGDPCHADVLLELANT